MKVPMQRPLLLALAAGAGAVLTQPTLEPLSVVRAASAAPAAAETGTPCAESCQRQRRTCVKEFRGGLREQRSQCRRSEPPRRSCRKAARRTFKSRHRGCEELLRVACEQCCANPGSVACHITVAGAPLVKKRPSGVTITCPDGAPTCDYGTTPNQCDFRFQLCPGPPSAEPEESEMAGCSEPVGIAVPLEMDDLDYKKGRLDIQLEPRSRDSDDPERLRLECLPTRDPRSFCSNPAGGASLMTFRVEAESELDLGGTGLGHNLEVPIGAELLVCLDGCDLDTNPVCAGTGSVGPEDSQSLNGEFLGPPMPLNAGGVPTCVLSTPRDEIRLHRLDLTSGEVDLEISLTWLFHQTSTTEAAPCPICTAPETLGALGTCASGPGAGRLCVVQGLSRFGNVSRDCPPDPANNVGNIPVDLRSTTAASILPGDGFECIPPPAGSGGPCPCPSQLRSNDCTEECSAVTCPSVLDSGIDQQCCNRADLSLPCFGGDVVRQDAAAALLTNPDMRSGIWPDPTYPKNAGITLAATFCVGRTSSSLVNAVAGLPGPGALLLSGTLTVE